MFCLEARAVHRLGQEGRIGEPSSDCDWSGLWPVRPVGWIRREQIIPSRPFLTHESG